MVGFISRRKSVPAVQSLKLRLLAAVSGVTVTVACAGGSGGGDTSDGGRGGESGSAGSSVSTAGAGTGGTTTAGASGAGTGGTTSVGASGAGGSAPNAGSGGTVGSAGASAGAAGKAPSAGAGGTNQSAGAAGTGQNAGAGGTAGSAPLGGAGGMGGIAVSMAGQPGRPFLIAGEQRRSEACPSGAWREPSLPASPSLERLPEAARARIAESFTNAALMEHASIAAFARFALELAALGAPAELVAATAEALADETRHARLCFELASRYAGRAVGPGALDVTGALEAVDLASVVERAFLEGCVGETAAALEARFAGEGATDPVVRSVLERIAEDEERHAALAFRFVAWAVAREPRLAAGLRAHVAALAAEPATDDALRSEPFAAELRAHGVPSPAESRAARRAALSEIVPELLAALERTSAGNEALGAAFSTATAAQHAERSAERC